MPPLLVCGPICLCLPDVCGLDGLIATTEQEERPWTTLDIVHTVARAVVDPEFPDPTADGVRIPEKGTLPVRVMYISIEYGCTSPIEGL